jgi:hypothetical protein
VISESSESRSSVRGSHCQVSCATGPSRAELSGSNSARHRNIRTIARDKELNVRADVYFCGNKAHVLSKLRYVFDSEGLLGHNPAPAKLGDGSSIYLYAAEGAEAARDIESGERSIPAYDLSRDARDVCVQLHGYNMALEGFSSNVAVARKQAIQEALKR